MPNMEAPPPSYDSVTGASSSSAPQTNTSSSSSRLEVPHKSRNGIPPMSRRSMEDQGRELPAGWIRQYDETQHHQFFVDTNANPPRSIWHHPYDDDQYMKSVSNEERQRIQGLHRVPSEADIIAESSDEDDHHGAPHETPHHTTNRPLPPRTDTSGSSSGGASRFGRRLKDKLTNTTHEEREKQRQLRAEQEQQEYAAHQAFRQCMSKAIDTGEPQYFGRDKQGREVYIESPYGPPRQQRGNGYGVNPYSQGPYANPNAKFIRPADPYNRPYGYGYGGGMGMMPLGMMPLGLGLGGGLMLGGLAGGIF